MLADEAARSGSRGLQVTSRSSLKVPDDSRWRCDEEQYSSIRSLRDCWTLTSVNKARGVWVRHMASVVLTSDLRVGHPVTRDYNSRSYSKIKYPNLCTVGCNKKTPIKLVTEGPIYTTPIIDKR